jgi:hypothetical protein
MCGEIFPTMSVLQSDQKDVNNNARFRKNYFPSLPELFRIKSARVKAVRRRG